VSVSPDRSGCPPPAACRWPACRSGPDSTPPRLTGPPARAPQHRRHLVLRQAEIASTWCNCDRPPGPLASLACTMFPWSTWRSPTVHRWAMIVQIGHVLTWPPLSPHSSTFSPAVSCDPLIVPYRWSAEAPHSLHPQTLDRAGFPAMLDRRPTGFAPAPDAVSPRVNFQTAHPAFTFALPQKFTFRNCRRCGPQPSPFPRVTVQD